MLSACINSLSHHLLESTKVYGETEIFCFFYMSGTGITLRAGDIEIPAVLSSSCVLPPSLQQGSFVRVVVLPMRRIRNRHKGLRLFERDSFFDVKEIEVLSFLTFLQETIKIPRTSVFTEYFDFNPFNEFMHMLKDFTGGAFYDSGFKGFTSALLGAPCIFLFGKKRVVESLQHLSPIGIQQLIMVLPF